MTFKKPDDITYTQMCIYIDENVYNKDCDMTLIYEYLYHITYMLARHANLFKKHHYYDDFSIFVANRVYVRLTNKKQFEMNDDGTFRMEKIKSILNYLKAILYPSKVTFEQSEYCQSISKETTLDNLNFNFDTLLNRTSSNIHLSDFKFMLHDVGKTCENFLSSLPYLKTSKEWLNIYTSVMLTFLNMITLPTPVSQRIEHLAETKSLNDDHIVSAYEKEQLRSAILFHLPDSMKDYILVLARQLKQLVAKDLSYIMHTKVTNDFNLVDYLKEEIRESIKERPNEY